MTYISRSGFPQYIAGSVHCADQDLIMNIMGGACSSSIRRGVAGLLCAVCRAMLFYLNAQLERVCASSLPRLTVSRQPPSSPGCPA